MECALLASTLRKVCLGLLSVIMVLASLQSSGGETNSFPKFNDESAGDYLKNMIRQVQDRVGDGPEANFVLARIQSQLGDTTEAERLIKRALENHPNNPEMQVFLAGIYIHQDRGEEAASLLRRALESKPGIPGGYSRLGMLLERLGDREGAQRAFERAVIQTPQDATALFLLGKMLLDQDKAREASVHLRKACQWDPGLASAFYVLARAQTQMGELDAAQQTLKRFQVLKQKEKAYFDEKKKGYDDRQVMRVLAAGFHTDVAGLYHRRQELDLAEAHARQAVLINPREPQGYEILVAILAQKGRLQEARAACDTLVRLQPERIIHRLNLSAFLLQLKDYPAAVAELKRALEMDPKHEQALDHLARIYLGTRQELPEALDLCRRLVEIQPSAANYDLLGWACYANSMTNEARSAAAQAVEKDPQNAAYRDRLHRLGGASNTEKP